ncbi:glycosyltransferase, partial [candidate division WWE3 bacterium]|nr:glycosyltransferase [candidate division WWE3 bacterium]
MPQSRKIAIVHDDFMQWGGAERLVASLAAEFPAATIYTSMADDAVLAKAGISRDRLRTSFLDRLPFKKSLNKLLFRIYPIVFENFVFDDYEVVISSSTRFAHGVITKPTTKHIAYVNSPFRGFWQPKMYFGDGLGGKVQRLILSPILSRLRQWDYVAGQRADVIFGNSSIVRYRLKKYYRRDDAEVFYPFVDFERFQKVEKPELKLPQKYFIVVSRIVEWKRIDIVVEACNKVGAALVVVGSGSYLGKLKKIGGDNVIFPGFLSDAEVSYLMRNAQALIHPQYEDFGMTIIEANFCETPVIAYKAGGALDTVVEAKTGEFFNYQTVDDLAQRLERFDSSIYKGEDLVENAKRFSKT